MKKFLKIEKTRPLLPFFLSLFFAFSATTASAYTIEISLPGLSTQSVTDPGTYVRYLFIFGLYLAGFLAVAVIAWGGINYMLASSASVGGVEKAKKWILGALGGIILLLCAWLVLYTIDPTLTNLSPRISPIGNVAEPDTSASPPPGSSTWSCSEGGAYDSQTDCASYCAGACVEQSAGQ